MANNEAFNALQREALSRLMTSIGVSSDKISDEVDVGIKMWRMHRFGATNPNLIKDPREVWFSCLDAFSIGRSQPETTSSIPASCAYISMPELAAPEARDILRNLKF